MTLNSNIENNNGTLSIYPSKWRSVGLLITSLLFIAVGTMLINKHNPAGYFITFIFVIGVIASIRSYLAPSLQIEISGEGIKYLDYYKNINFIPWCNIEKVDEVTLKNKKAIGIKVSNLEELIKNQKSLIIKRTMEFNSRIYQCPVIIETESLSKTHEQIMEQIKLFFNKKSQKQTV